MKKKQQLDASARIAMIALIAIVVSLIALIAIGKSSEAAEAIPPTPIQWTPTAEDRAYMDSMRSMDAATKADIDTIRGMVTNILLKLE